MSTDVLNTITGDQYNTLAALRALSENYFDIAPDNSKLGLFGYINESLAHISKGSVFHRNMMYSEYFLNTASMPSSIYNAAIDETIEIPMARPAQATVVISIKKVDVDTYLDANSTTTMILDRKDTLILMDNYVFMLPFSVVLKRSNQTGGYVYTASYQSIDISDEIQSEYLINTLFEEYQRMPPISVANQTIGDNEFITFPVDVFNMQMLEEEHKIYTNNLSDRILFPVAYTDQLFTFKAMYKLASEDEFGILPMYQNKSLVESVERYGFYTHINDSEYHIFFSSTDDTFRLAVNSTLRMETYITKGLEGNFKFNGVPVLQNSSLGLVFTCAILSNPSNGSDKLSLRDLKKAIFEARM